MKLLARVAVLALLVGASLGAMPPTARAAAPTTASAVVRASLGTTDVVSWGNVQQYSMRLPQFGPTGAAAISADGALVLKRDGTVATWDAPSPPPGLSGVIKVASANGIYLALKSDGTVVGWNAQLVGGPAVPVGLTGVVDIEVGSRFALALKDNGTVVAWGDDSVGQTNVPTGLSGVTAIFTGAGVNEQDYAVALKSDGTVVAWGDNAPAVPAGLTGVASVSLGTGFALALKRDGTVVAWGSDTAGTAVPAGLSGVASVVAASGTAAPAGYPVAGMGFAVKTDGTAVQWGGAGFCDASSNFPADLTNVVSITTDSVMGAAIKSDGTVVQWGDTCSAWMYGVPADGVVAVAFDGSYGYAVTAGGEVLRSGMWTEDSNQPSGLAGAVAIDAGSAHEIARMGSGNVVAWGDDAWGQTDIGTDFTGVTQVAAGGTVVFGRKSDGTVVYLNDDTWYGTNPYLPPAGLTGVTVVDCGGDFGGSYALALKSNGTVVAWGDAYNGQTAVPVGLTGVTAVSAGGDFALALKSNHTIVGWGSFPAIPAGLTTATAIAAGRDFALALKSDHTVVAWGDNAKGQANVPAGLTNVTAIAAGADFALALKSDGTVVAWGNDDHGQTDVPVGLTAVTQITAGDDFSSVLTTASPDAASVTVSGLSTPRTTGVWGAITVQVKTTSSALDYAYRGTIHFTSSDASASLPNDYTFTGADHGSHVFMVAAATAGSQSITATDTVTAILTGTQSSIAVVAPVVPGMPANVSAIGGNGAVGVSWTPPIDAGGRPIEVYTVTSDPDGKTCTTTVATTCIVTGLTNGTAYTFSVTAANSAGTSDSSTDSAIAVPGEPDAPTGVAGVGFDGSITITWAVAVDNGSAITGYTVSLIPSTGACTTTGALTCSITGLTDKTAYSVQVSAINGNGQGAASNPITVVPRVGATFIGLVPSRLLDTRGSAKLVANTPYTFQVTGRASGDATRNVPANATAVTGVLTVLGGSAAGFVSLTPEPVSVPTTSTINFPKGDARSSGVTVPVGSGGKVSITYGAVAANTVDAIFDVTGYFVTGTSGSTYVALTPNRIVDSRSTVRLGITTGQLTAGTAKTFPVTNRTGSPATNVPANAVAVTGTLTVTGQTAAGYLSLGPGALNAPPTASLYFPKGDNRATGLTVKLGPGGTLGVTFTSTTAGAKTDVIFDVTGYFVPGNAGATYVAVTPNRLLDSRPTTSGHTNTGFAGVVKPYVARSFQVTGRLLSDLTRNIPAGAVAVTGTLTVTGQTTAGFLSLTNLPINKPTTSSLNFPAGDTRATGVTVPLSPGGQLSVTYGAAAGASTNVLFDVSGYFLN